MENFVQGILSTGLFIHVIAGVKALVSGLIALGLFRRPVKHRKVGKVFFYSMLVVFVTAISISAYKGIDFLVCIAVFSFYLVFKGVRSLRKFKGSETRWYDHGAAIAFMISGLYLITKAFTAFQNDNLSSTVIYAAFSVFMVVKGIQGMRQFSTKPSRDPFWFREHKGSMGGALIATMTAFGVTALSFLPDVLV